MSVSGNLSGIPMFGSMMVQGNQSMAGLGAMLKHGGLFFVSQ
jgi:hypothetical protein